MIGGKYPVAFTEKIKQKNVAKCTITSANGSKIFPKSLTSLFLRAKYPSKKSVNSINANIGIAIATESSANLPVHIGKKYKIKKTGESKILDNVNLFDNFM